MARFPKTFIWLQTSPRVVPESIFETSPKDPPLPPQLFGLVPVSLFPNHIITGIVSRVFICGELQLAPSPGLLISAALPMGRLPVW